MTPEHTINGERALMREHTIINERDHPCCKFCGATAPPGGLGDWWVDAGPELGVVWDGYACKDKDACRTKVGKSPIELKR